MSLELFTRVAGGVLFLVVPLSIAAGVLALGSLLLRRAERVASILSAIAVVSTTAALGLCALGVASALQTTVGETAPAVVVAAFSEVLWLTAAAGAILCLVAPIVVATMGLRPRGGPSVHLVASIGVAIASTGTGIFLLRQVSGMLHGFQVLLSTAPDRRVLAFTEEVPPTSSLPLLVLWVAALGCVLVGFAVGRNA